MKKPCIIGISGSAGVGKSSLAACLQKTLNATVIAWDDFDDISTGPDDYVAWLAQGGDYAAWQYPQLASTLQTLKSGADTNHPATNLPLRATRHIVFDAPLGRLHEQTGKWIDCWIHITVPLDISLARRIIRDFSCDTKSKKDVMNALEQYLESSRPLFLDERYKNEADYVVDGSQKLDVVEKKILQIIENWKGSGMEIG